MTAAGRSTGGAEVLAMTGGAGGAGGATAAGAGCFCAAAPASIARSAGPTYIPAGVGRGTAADGA